MKFEQKWLAGVRENGVCKEYFSATVPGNVQRDYAEHIGILDEQQYIGYLKGIGRGKEYKKGKDGLYYKKEELAKQKAESKSKKK